jgi:hypothetical protein
MLRGYLRRKRLIRRTPGRRPGTGALLQAKASEIVLQAKSAAFSRPKTSRFLVEGGNARPSRDAAPAFQRRGDMWRYLECGT